MSLKDVAKQAGVSASTVSRVLSNKPFVNERTRERVMDAVRLLDYKPNELAKSLKSGRSNTIAVMVPSIQNLIFPTIVRGIEDTARKAGFVVFLCNTDESMEVEREYIDKLRTRFIDGFIVATMMPDSEHIRELKRAGFPVVLTSRIYGEDFDAVGIDNERAAYDATHYLIRSGHRRIAFAMGRWEIPLYTDRHKGYVRALEEADLPYDDGLVIHETNGTESFYSLTQTLVRRGVAIDAVLASSDPKAFVVMRALRDAGLSIPGDVSVIGIDNVETSALMEPPLSTVAQPLYEIGALAAKKLIRQIQHKEKTGTLAPPQVDILNTDLIIRKSTR